MDLLRDSIWQFVGVILSIAGIVVTVVFFFAQRSRKSMSCYITFNSKLFSIRREAQDKLRVFYEGKPVSNLRLLVLRIQNTGNQPILTQDFDEPIGFTFNEGINIIDGEIGSTKPDNLRINLTKVDKELLLSPILFNPGDYVEVNLLIDGAMKDFRVSGRVIGVTQIKTQGTLEVENLQGTAFSVGPIAYILTGILALLATYVLLSSVVGYARSWLESIPGQ